MTELSDIFAERVAEERRKLEERESQWRREKAEADRVAAIERKERQVILRIEKKLKLLGAFCTASVKFPTCSGEKFPTCIAVMPRPIVDAATDGLIVDEIVFVVDSSATLYAFARKTEQFIASAVLRSAQGTAIGTPVSVVCKRYCLCGVGD